MIQATSQEAYNSIIKELGYRQMQVYKMLKSIEPACNKRIAKELGMPINEITPRISELRYKGVVEQAYKEVYEGKKVIFWHTIDDRIKKILVENPVEWKPEAVSWLHDED